MGKYGLIRIDLIFQLSRDQKKGEFLFILFHDVYGQPLPSAIYWLSQILENLSFERQYFVSKLLLT